MNSAIQKVYDSFLMYLLDGRRDACYKLIDTIQPSATLEDIYFDLLQPALYEVGRLWETNKIAVANEHMATAIVEAILYRVFSKLSPSDSVHRTLLMACPELEFHQVGPKMIADYFEYKGWRTYFIGVNSSPETLIKEIHLTQPDLLGLSFALSVNLTSILKALDQIQNKYPKLSVIVGGRGVSLVDQAVFEPYKQVSVLGSLDALKHYVAGAK